MSFRLLMVCCGRDDGSQVFETWEQAEAFRASYIDLQGHERSAIIEPSDGKPGGWEAPK